MVEKNRTAKAIIISPQARQDIQNILNYLSLKWNQKAVDKFLNKLEAFYTLISFNPTLFSYYDKKRNVRKYVLSRQNIIFYRITKDAIQIITVFDTRQDPQKLKRILKE